RELRVAVVGERGVGHLDQQEHLLRARVPGGVGVLGREEGEGRLRLRPRAQAHGALNPDDGERVGVPNEEAGEAAPAARVAVSNGCHGDDAALDELHAVLGAEDAGAGHRVVLVHGEQPLARFVGDGRRGNGGHRKRSGYGTPTRRPARGVHNCTVTLELSRVRCKLAAASLARVLVPPPRPRARARAACAPASSPTTRRTPTTPSPTTTSPPTPRPTSRGTAARRSTSTSTRRSTGSPSSSARATTSSSTSATGRGTTPPPASRS